MWQRHNSEVVDGLVLSPGALDRAQFLMNDCSDRHTIDDRTRAAFARLRADRILALEGRTTT